MRTSQNGINMIKGFEGLRLRAYRDVADVLTIGYGTTKNVKEGQVITEREAEDLLRSDVVIFEKAVSTAVSVPISQSEFDALVSFTYNVGAGAFRKSTLLRKLNSGKNKNEVALEFDKWVNAGGRYVQGLANRRKKEKELFLSWQ